MVCQSLSPHTLQFGPDEAPAFWQATAQHVVTPEDKATARALGLCMKLKHNGAYVRFKAKRLREHDLEHSTTTAAKVRRRWLPDMIFCFRASGR